MVRTQDRFSGNILLYDYLSARRAPVFLNRNLTRALRVHQQLSEGTVSPITTGDQPNSRSTWKPPDHDTLDYMMDLAGSRGSFILDVHRIVPRTAPVAISTPEQVRHNTKSRVLIRTTSTLQVEISPTLPGLQGNSIVYQTASLQKTQQAGDDDRSVSICTERIVVTPTFPSALPQKEYKIRVTIEIDDPSGADEVFKYLLPEGKKRPKNSNRLSAEWSNILRCPSNKNVLLAPIYHWQGSSKFGLEVSMCWASFSENSILEAHKRLLRRLPSSKILTRSLTPNMTDKQVKATFKYGDKIMMEDGFICPHERDKFKDAGDLRVHFDLKHMDFTLQAIPHGVDSDGVENWTFICEVSPYKSRKGKQRPSARADESYSYLHLSSEAGLEARPLTRLYHRFTNPAFKKFADSVSFLDRPFDNHWNAPAIHFNREQYLSEGNDDFTRLGRSKKSYTEPRATETMPMNTRGAQNQSLPDRIPERAPKERKKRYPVPAAPPGVTFFRARSKRPLVTGECVSESDNETDDTWISSRKSAEFDKKVNVSTATKEFLKVFDTHMRSEQLHSDLHAGEALIRFAHKKRAWIRRQDVHDAFNKKLDELLEDKIISEMVHAECVDIVESAGHVMGKGNHEISERLAQLEVRESSHDDLYDGLPPLRSNERRPDKGKGKAKVTDTGHLTPITADSDGDLEMREAALSIEVGSASTVKETVPPLPYDQCLCGEDAQASYRKSPFIACTSLNCIRRTFHYNCIKDRWKVTQDFRALRKLAWICEDCKPQSAPGN
ncbi:hypothetical protein DE146DRAFT_751040 [Phaeosphaeria sp. MPI-PUGE-AT-0046c]|nr:hypothetical protein DE146DRAFT_751040 [Phaeosphaeria sp. MPI-PUGE-AT-0046c]